MLAALMMRTILCSFVTTILSHCEPALHFCYKVFAETLLTVCALCL